MQHGRQMSVADHGEHTLLKKVHKRIGLRRSVPDDFDHHRVRRKLLHAHQRPRRREKNVYDELVKAELTDYLRDASEVVDLIVSAGALVYFGDLESVVAAAARTLRPNGLFVFTLEHAVGAGAAADYRLEWHGRYSHSQAYVEGLLARSGLRAEITHADLRTESGAPVAGLVIRATKSTAAQSGDG